MKRSVRHSKKESRLCLRRKYAVITLRGIAAIFLFASSIRSSAQADIHFSQFYETSILRNPALTGVFSDDYKLGAYYRNQWSSISNPFATFLVSAESHFTIKRTSEDFVSVGFLSYYDQAGSIDQKITTFYPAINYNKSLNPDHKAFLSFGFTGGYNQYSFDPSKATFNSQYVNGSYSSSNPNFEHIPNSDFTLWDLGAGINFNTSTGEYNNTTYIIGLSAFHLTEPKFSYYDQANGINEYMRVNSNFAVVTKISDAVSVQLESNYATQGTYREIIGGALINYAQTTEGVNDILILSGGLFYRFDDAIIPIVKLSYRHLAVGLSYDVNVSTLDPASNLQGGFEMTLFYTGNYSSGNDATKKTMCPRF